MSVTTTIKPDEVWLTRRQAARLARLSVERFDASIRKALAADDVTGRGRAQRLRGEAVVDAIVAHRGKDDPLMTAGGDSPALERYRMARAAIVEMDKAERERTHIPLAKLDNVLVQFSSSLRRGGETLQRRFGNDAAAIFNDAITSAEQHAKGVISAN